MTAQIQEFTTDRLLLRNISLLDAPAYQLNFVDYDVVQFLNERVPWPYPKDGAAAFIEIQILPRQGKDRWFWSICEKHHPDTLIGGIELWRPGTPENRGFWLGKKFWGKGYMSEAAGVITDYAFNRLEFETLIFNNAVANVRSSRIKEKAGARLIRSEPDRFVDRSVTELEVWELSKADWLASREI